MKKSDEIFPFIMRGLTFIQEKYKNALSLEDVAVKAGYSPYHFHRLFTFFQKESPFKHIRRLRLQNAANQLHNPQLKIIDIAFQAGFDSQASFSTAFKDHFGLSPRVFRKQLKAKKWRPQVMPVQIKKIPPLKVLFVRKEGPYDETPKQAWDELFSYALLDEQTRYFSLAYDNPDVTDKNRLRYDACISISGMTAEKGLFCQQVLRGGYYAIFEHKGTCDSLADAFIQIYSDYLPNSPYTPSDNPPFVEHFSKPNEGRFSSEKLIYVPINNP